MKIILPYNAAIQQTSAYSPSDAHADGFLSD